MTLSKVQILISQMSCLLDKLFSLHIYLHIFPDTLNYSIG